MHYESKLFEKAHHIKEASKEERDRLATTNLTIAKYLVGMSYKKLGRYPSVADRDKDYLAEYNRLIIIAQHNPTEYAKAVSDFDRSSAANEVPELEAEVAMAFNAMNAINVGGERRADAPKVLASRLIGGIGKYSAKSLGVDVSRIDSSKKTLMSKIFGKGTFDPNERGTKAEDRAQTIDRDLFKTERLYRMQLENDIKRLKARGGLSDEEMRLVAEHNKMKKAQIGIGKKETTEAQRIMASMTVGEKAMYDIAKLPFTMLKGIGKFMLGPKRTRARKGIEDETSIDVTSLVKPPATPEKEISNVEKHEHKKEVIEKKAVAANIEEPEETMESLQAAIDANPYREKPRVGRDAKGRFTKIEKSDDTASKVESADISSDYDAKNIELSEKNNDKLDKQIELLGKIDEDIKDNKNTGTSNVIEAVALAALLRSAIVSAGTFIAEIATSTTGIAAAVVAIPIAVSAALESKKRKEDIAESKDRGYAVGNESPSPSVSDVVKGGRSKEYELAKNAADAKYSKYGYSGMSGNFVDANGNRISDDKAHEMRKAIDDPFSIEPVKKTTSSKLSDKKVKADETKAKKTTEAMAGAVSNVVHNAPNNSIVATPIANKNRGRDNPRNPDNQLNEYLKSRVMKYC